MRVKSLALSKCFLKKFKNAFYVSLLKRSIQDHLDHGTSKEPENR